MKLFPVNSNSGVARVGHKCYPVWPLKCRSPHNTPVGGGYGQGRIIHEAGEAETSGPGTTKIYKVGPLWAPKFLQKICGLLKFLPSAISIRPAVLPQFTPRLTNQLITNNKQQITKLLFCT